MVYVSAPRYGACALILPFFFNCSKTTAPLPLVQVRSEEQRWLIGMVEEFGHTASPVQGLPPSEGVLAAVCGHSLVEEEPGTNCEAGVSS